MNDDWSVPINLVATRVPGLDEVLAGGVPEYSLNMITGGPGVGKTILAHQIAFASASAECQVLYLTVLGEPALKMLRYQQKMSFFDSKKVGTLIHFVDLSDEVSGQDYDRVFASILREIQRLSPCIVVIDSFRTLLEVAPKPRGPQTTLRAFLHRLAVYLAGWQTTSFMVGEFPEQEIATNPLFTLVDGIIWLSQPVDRNSIVRKLQVIKMRGQAFMPGLHTFHITRDGLQIFPRMVGRGMEPEKLLPERRISTGVKGLDEMMGGGLPAGDAVLLAGPSGSGKTVLTTQFIAEGVARQEPCVVTVFEEHPPEYLRRAKSLGHDLEASIRQNKLKIIYLRPLDLSVAETFQEIRKSVEQLGAKRVIIDSLSGFELALAATFREDFRESLYRLVGGLTSIGVTVLMTVEVVAEFNELRFTPLEISFLADDIILLRYVELEGQLRKVIAVVKMRGSGHSKDFREYEITSRGVVIGRALTDYQGIIRGEPVPRQKAERPTYPGLTDQETRVLKALIDLHEGTPETMEQATGIKGRELTDALSRLVTLNYAVQVVEKGKSIYRPFARALGM